MEKVAVVCFGGMRSACKMDIQKLNEQDYLKMDLLFLISEQTESGNGGPRELIDTLSRHIPLKTIKELYLKYGYEGLAILKNNIDAKEQMETLESLDDGKKNLKSALQELNQIKEYKEIRIDNGNYRKKGKEIKPWNKTKFYQK